MTHIWVTEECSLDAEKKETGGDLCKFYVPHIKFASAYYVHVCLTIGTTFPTKPFLL